MILFKPKEEEKKPAGSYLLTYLSGFSALAGAYAGMMKGDKKEFILNKKIKKSD
jgi:hypothetical protein